ncbi:hypothetical protein [Mucilaginibacter auburnensis]|uniref:Uncharacterized protein n=1 Tax=Mucilaginibacter auburnensis TaxID=1457233 RepID=A0A2H9VUF3_9SPHI|nr:hypothetical protein [Mucilaginibacter auburnensis]PJJ84422.1 hypothetical protein CLV57_1433 [Mucilaginibacter auburnensis]
MKRSLIATAVLLLFVASSCTSPDENKIFANYAPSAPEYKRELIRIFLTDGTKNFQFNFKELVNFNSQTYMKLNITGAGTNAEALVAVTNWTKLEDIQRTKGLGYAGAELKNLQLDIAKSEAEPILSYRTLDRIID